MKPNSISTLFFFCAAIFFTGCVGRQAYYVSPFNGLNNHYHTIPLQADSIRSAFYAKGSLSWGHANDFREDRSFAGNLNLSHSLNFGSFQAFYGAGVSTGSFSVDTFEMNGNNETVNPSVINAAAGKKRFSGVGFEGGINVVVPMQNGEWRALGVETSFRKEFGSYLAFRKNLPDSAATWIVRSDTYGTIGGFTEILAEGHLTTYGFKFGAGTVIGKNYRSRSIVDNGIGGQNLIYNYLHITFHLTRGKWTGYLQCNDATKATAFLMGANYRFGK